MRREQLNAYGNHKLVLYWLDTLCTAWKGETANRNANNVTGPGTTKTLFT